MYELKEDLCLTADKSKAVPYGSEGAKFLLGRKGARITDKQAQELGLAKKPEVKTAKAPDLNLKKAEKSEDKAVKKFKNKGSK